MATHLGAVQRRLPRLLLAQSTRPIASSARAVGGGAALPKRARHFRPSPLIRCTVPRVMSTEPQLDGEGADPEEGGVAADMPDLDTSVLANIYNHRRAHYNRAVSALRKQYFAEIEAQREQERRRKAKEDAEFRRKTLERRRLKAMRSAKNAEKQMERSAERRAEWEAELAQTQRERDAKKEVYRRARQKIVDELEAECHLWLTTPEEVDRALGNVTASQILWSRPGGMVGAPSGPETGFGDHGDFWRFECHTWDARPIYKDPKEVMLEEIENLAYLRANQDEKYWTKEKVEEHERQEQRARLRAIVREEGRRSLLNKQREMMRDIYTPEQGRGDDSKGGRLPPSVMPAPKLDYLADFEAQEAEGVKILKKDPRRFFIFESDLPNSGNLKGLHRDEDGDKEEGDASGATLGRPIGLRNPFFGDKPTAFPLKIGRDLPPDTRTEKEKKRDERQERMRVAAEEAALAAEKGTSYEVAMAAEEDLEDGSEDVNYDQAEEDAENELWADQEEAWTDRDREVFDITPPMARLTTDDVDWVINELKARSKKVQARLDFEDSQRRQELERSKTADGSIAKPLETVDDLDRYVMETIGYDMERIESLVRELTPEQSRILEDIDFTGRAGLTAEDMKREISVVPGLTDEQVQALVELEMSLMEDTRLKAITKME